MRWLLICLFASLGALLLAAAGVARHILLQRRGVRAQTAGTISLSLGQLRRPPQPPTDETEFEHEL
jgi:hypothetical protein